MRAVGRLVEQRVGRRGREGKRSERYREGKKWERREGGEVEEEGGTNTGIQAVFKRGGRGEGEERDGRWRKKGVITLEYRQCSREEEGEREQEKNETAALPNTVPLCLCVAYGLALWLNHHINLSPIAVTLCALLACCYALSVSDVTLWECRAMAFFSFPANTLCSPRTLCMLTHDN